MPCYRLDQVCSSQEDKPEVLHCPAESKRDKQGAGYTTLTGLLEGFGIDYYPRKLNIASMY